MLRAFPCSSHEDPVALASQLHLHPRQEGSHRPCEMSICQVTITSSKDET